MAMPLLSLVKLSEFNHFYNRVFKVLYDIQIGGTDYLINLHSEDIVN